MAEQKTTVKIFTAYVILDYRNGEMRIIKKPKSVKPYEITAQLNIKVNVPAKQEIKFDAEITLSENKISDITSELV